MKGDIIQMRKLNYTDLLAELGISSAHPGGLNLSKTILSKENINKEMHVLDIGCGTGQSSAFLAKNYKCNVTSLDAHSTMVEKAKKRFNNKKLQINLLKANAEALPFKDDNFDLILAESVLVFTSIDLSLPELYRVLKPNAKLISIEMTTTKDLNLFEKAEIQNVYGIQKILTEKEWTNHFTNVGFSTVSVEHEENVHYQHIASEENDPSPYIDPTLFTILESHVHIMEKFKDRLTYRIFKCIK